MQFFTEDGCSKIAICHNAFIDAHFEPAEHDRNQAVVVMSVIFIDESIYPPAGAGAANEVKYLAWLYWRVFFQLAIQSVHDALQDVESGEPTHTAAIEREQAESCGIERVWHSLALRRSGLLHVLICRRTCSSMRRDKSRRGLLSAL
jgi:hypothetical protein